VRAVESLWKVHMLTRVFRSAAVALPLLSLLAGCFGTMQVVPASAGPKPPAGSGWYCVQYASSSGDGSACFRKEEECRSTASEARSRPGSRTHVGFCEARASAVCSATFTNEKDANFSCFVSASQCQSQVGGMAGFPGTKQSECAQYD
jgi:hypothetical protein